MSFERQVPLPETRAREPKGVAFMKKCLLLLCAILLCLLLAACVGDDSEDEEDLNMETNAVSTESTVTSDQEDSTNTDPSDDEIDPWTKNY